MIARLLISNNLETRLKEISNILDSFIQTNDISHPDILYIKAEENLGIAEARKIKEHFSLKPYSAKGRMVIIEDSSTMTTEAQNALLKTLEELPETSLFVIGAKSENELLPTIISRCQITILKDSKDSQNQSFQDDLVQLIDSPMAKRFEFVEKLKDKREFLFFMTRYFHQLFLREKPKEKQKLGLFLEELLLAERWAKQNVNIRGILEYLMLSMPSEL